MHWNWMCSSKILANISDIVPIGKIVVEQDKSKEYIWGYKDL